MYFGDYVGHLLIQKHNCGLFILTIFFQTPFLVEETGQFMAIEDVVLHPDYNGQAYHDIAVVKLRPNKCKFLTFDSPI